MLHRLLPVAAILAAAAIPASASATTFKVTKATHTSTSSKAEANYTGLSTVTWSLAPATKAAPNRIGVNSGGGMVTGMGQVNVRGSYAIDAMTQDGHCAWTAATGSSEYPGLAPEPFTLTLGPDVRTGKGLLATFGAARATLSNQYLGSECTTGISGEPKYEETSAVAVKPSALKRKKVTLRSTGATSRNGIDYSWSTTIVLKRR